MDPREHAGLCGNPSCLYIDMMQMLNLIVEQRKVFNLAGGVVM